MRMRNAFCTEIYSRHMDKVLRYNPSQLTDRASRSGCARFRSRQALLI
jgi:hypothetical protein